MRVALLNNFCLTNCCKDSHSMESRRDGVTRLQEICEQLVLRMGGFSYARIVNSG